MNGFNQKSLRVLWSKLECCDSGSGFSQSSQLFRFMNLTLVTGLAAGWLQMMIPLYAISLQASNAEVGIMRGVAQIGNVLAAIPAGLLADRYGARLVFLLGGLADAVLICAMPFISHLSGLILLMFLEGALSSLRWTALSAAYFEQLERSGRGRASWMGAVSGLGFSLLGPLAAGPILAVGDYAPAFFLIAALIMLSTAATWLFHRRLLGKNKKPPWPDIRQQWGHSLTLLSDRRFLHMALVQCLARAMASAFSVFILVLMAHKMRSNPAVISLVVSTQGAGYILMMFVGAGPGRRVRRRDLYRCCLILQGLGLTAAGLSQQLWLIWLGSLLMGLGTGWITAISVSLVRRMAGDKGQISGCYNLFSGTGIALGPLAGSLLIYGFGLRAAFLGFLPLILAMVGFLGYEKGRLAESYPS